MLKAVDNVKQTLGPSVIGLDALDQAEVDRVLLEADGTPNKSKLGANAILGVSMAVARAAADAIGLPLWRYLGGANARVLPTPLMNVINGGAHADNGLEIQEFMIVPAGRELVPGGAPRRRRGLPDAQEDPQGQGPHHRGRRRGRLRAAPRLERGGGQHARRARSRTPATSRARTSSSRSTARRASSTTRREELHVRQEEGQRRRARRHLREALVDSTRSSRSRTAAPRTTGTRGSSSPTSSARRCSSSATISSSPTSSASSAASTSGIANSILIKLNQIGTLTETLDAIRMGADAGYRSIISHRSGETEDTFIADLAVATNAGQIKTGSLSRSDRVAKYNQLLRIGFELGTGAVYAGHSPFKRAAPDRRAGTSTIRARSRGVPSGSPFVRPMRDEMAHERAARVVFSSWRSVAFRMKPIEELLKNLGRPEVLEFGLVTNRLPSVNIGGKFEPVDDEAPTTDVLLQMLVTMGGSRYVEQLSEQARAVDDAPRRRRRDRGRRDHAQGRRAGALHGRASR